MQHDFSELRSAVHSSPDESNFVRVMTILSGLVGHPEASSLMHYAEAALERWPSRARRLTSRQATIALDPKNVYARLVHHLDLGMTALYGRVYGRDWTEHLVAAQHLSNLETLDLTSTLMNARSWQELERAEHLVGLRGLSLRHVRMELEGLRGLARCTWAHQLDSLDLLGAEMGDAAHHLFEAEELMSDLKQLDVSLNRLDERACAALAKPSNGASLTTLSMCEVGLNQERMQVLSLAPWWRALNTLELRGNQLGGASMDVLMDVPMESLECLDVSSAMVDQQGLETLARASHLSTLKTLRLDSAKGVHGGRVFLDDLTPLLRAPYFSGLEELILGSGFDGNAVAEFAAATHLDKLRHLSCRHGRADASMFALWRDAGHLKSLRELNLDYGELDDEGLEHVTASPCFHRLEVFEARGNHITDAGLEAMTPHVLSSPHLRRLVLTSNAISREAAVKFYAHERVKQLDFCDVLSR